MLVKIYKKISSLVRPNSIYILLSSLLFVVWYKILFQYFYGEGAIYVARGASSVFAYDLGAALQFKVFVYLFRDNMFLYQLWVLITFIIISIFFYKLVYEIAKNKVISFASVIFFSLNYSGTFEMLAFGQLENYAQRVIYFLLLFPSLTYFIRFLKERNKILFIISLALYSIAIFFGDYTIYFLFFYFTYFLCHIVYNFNKKPLKEILTLTFYALFFPLVTGIVIYLDKLYGGGTLVGNSPKGGLYYFLFKDTYNTYNETMKQLILLSIPEKIVKAILTYISILSNYQFQFTYIGTGIKIFYLPVTGVYLLAILLVAKLKRALLPAVVSSFLYMFLVFVVNEYIRKEIITQTFGQSRYLFGPSIGFAVFWGIVLYSVVYKKINKILFFFIIAAWAYINVLYLWQDIDKNSFFMQKGMKTSMDYIKSISQKFSDDSIVIVPSVLGPYNTDAAKLFYGKKTMFFQPYYYPWEKLIKRPFDPKKDFIIIYDYKKGIVDRTKDINEILTQRKKGIYPDVY